MEEKSFRDIDPLWALNDPLTVEQAAALIAGEEPNAVVFSDAKAWHFENPETGHTESVGISRVQTAYKALISAIMVGKLKAKVMHDSRPFNDDDQRNLIDLMECGEYFNVGQQHVAEEGEKYLNGYFVKEKPNWATSLVGVDDLKNWLISRNMKTGFFFESKEKVSDYLDRAHPRFSAKLAAAINVWEAMDDENLLNGKSPKTAMTEWLTSRYKELGLVHNGKISNNAIENVVAVVNWQTTGGAPKTPS